jgi:meiotically up-regulated gene 157 (Mug157) protein
MVPLSMQRVVEQVSDTLPEIPRLPKMFGETFSNTYTTTLQKQSDWAD